MRHEAAYERRASLWEDLGIGVAVAAMAGAAIIGIGLWYHYVNGAISSSPPRFWRGIAASGRRSFPR
jgi:hypothetical protein